MMSNVFILGIDDASRCPVIGSLTIAGVCADRKTLRYFKRIGVKDSKLLNKKDRFKLFEKILKHASVSTRKITAEEISKQYRIKNETLNLNDKEMICYLAIANEYVGVNKIIVDNFEHSRDAFIERAEKFSSEEWSKWIIEHNADLLYTIVGAASIVAKCISDIEMDEYRKKHNVGSGNPNDKLTEAFIKKHLKHKTKCKNGCNIIRWSWYTIDRLSHKE